MKFIIEYTNGPVVDPSYLDRWIHEDELVSRTIGLSVKHNLLMLI